MAKLKRIHVDQHRIKSNTEKFRRQELAREMGRTEEQIEGSFDCNPILPPISVKTYNSNTKAFEVEIDGPSKVVYSPDKPLSCGARLWIETKAPVIADGQEVT